MKESNCWEAASVLLIILLRILLMMGSSSKTMVQSQWVQRKTATQEGDLTIGYLFSMHEQPDQKSAHTRTCGRIWEEYGIQRAEATYQTIQQINADPNILPGIRLGFEIRDDCWYAPVALEQTLEFIRDAVAPPHGGGGRMNNSSSSSQMTYPMSSSNSNSLTTCSSHLNGNKNGNCTIGMMNNKKSGNNSNSKILVGVIGPGSSAVSIQVQNLLQLFHIPQIGYSATSRDLSDKNRFRYFLRVVPPDELQARAMLQIVQKYNWTYVSAVSTEGSYGQSGLQVFREYADRADICIAKEYSILSNDDNSEYDKLLERMLEEPKARVVVCFCEGETVHAILKAIRRFNRTGHFLLVGSDGWADRLDVVQGYEAEAEGGISIRIHSPRVDSFDREYFALKPDRLTLARNPWFQEFWEHRFNCTLVSNRPLNNGTLAVASGRKLCTGVESLKEKYKQDSKMGFVIKATLAMAWALHHLQQSVCGAGSSGLCPAMLPVDGSLLRDHLLSVSFLFGNETVTFDSNGNPPGWYDIMNYQPISSSSNEKKNQSIRYNYVQIGTWKNGTLDLPDRPVKMVTSVCSEPCHLGQIKIIQKELSCCWQCVTCDPHERVLNETTCQECPWGYWPDINKTECEEIEAQFSHWSDADSIAAVTLSVVGLLATLATAAVFAWHNDTPVVKASTRELTYLILVGMALCYLTTFPLLALPDTLNCTLSRIMPGFSFSLIFAALLTKTNRIARILAGSKKRIRTKKSRWLSLTAQIIITMTMITVEVVLIVLMLILEPAESVKHFPTRNRVQIVCNTTTKGLMAPLGFDFFLIGMCTVYAVKTRNLPENFNEAKFIGFAMYTTCVIWVAFVPIYFSGSESKTLTLCICISLSAVVTLVLLFGPKLYIIIFKPEKNNRSAFTTTADLRIHIAGGTMKYNPTQSGGKQARQHPVGKDNNRETMKQNHQHQRLSSLSAASSFDGNHSGIVSRLSSAANRGLGAASEGPPGRSSAAILNKNSGSSGGGAANINGDKSKTNMTFLRRAFGSQLDLAEGESGSSSTKRRHEFRSVESQTDCQLFFIENNMSSSAGNFQHNKYPSEGSDEAFNSSGDDDDDDGKRRHHKRWASIIERKVALTGQKNNEEEGEEEDVMMSDIIISLGHRINNEQGGVSSSSADCGNNLHPTNHVDDGNGDADDNDEAYFKLESLGIIVSKGSQDIGIL